MMVFFCGVPGRAQIFDSKSIMGPTEAIISQMARVYIVSWNLKEAAGKPLA